MAFIDYSKKLIQAKIVYYGPGMSGKTTNLQVIHESIAESQRGKLVSISTESERTLFFDFLPVRFASAGNCAIQFQFFTVPGQSFYNYSRRAVLQGVDGIVFVADSGADRQDANLDSWLNMGENLAHYGVDPRSVSTVVQFNKRDLPDAASVESMHELLGTADYHCEMAVAAKKVGVAATMRAILDKVVRQLVAKTTPKSGSLASSS